MEQVPNTQYRILPAEVRLSSDKKKRTWIINTSKLDSHNTVVDPNGGSLERYNSNPIVLINHNHNLVAATSTVRYDNGRLIASIDEDSWDMDDPEIAKWKRKVDKGLVKGASIGFEPLRWQREVDDNNNEYFRITEWSLYEWSIVSVPSNPETLQRASELNVSTYDQNLSILSAQIDSINEALDAITEQLNELRSPVVETIAEDVQEVEVIPDNKPVDRTALLKEAAEVVRLELLRQMGRA